jgi:hypothetical protein
MPAGPKNAAALRVIPEDDGGLTLEDLFSDTLTFEMEVKGKRLQVTWAPARYTPVLEEMTTAIVTASENEEDELAGLPDDERERRQAETIRAENKAIREFLSGVLVSWTLHRADGTEIGTDMESLRALPAVFLREVFTVLSSGAGPKDATEPPSAPSSSATD